MQLKKRVLLLVLVIFVIILSLSVSAKIAVYNFCDFQEESCKSIEDSMDIIEDLYMHDVIVEYYHLPNSNVDSVFAAMAAECARDQDMFEEMKDSIYENNHDLSRDALKDYAEDLGLQTNNFSFCLDIRQKEYVVKEHVEFAEGKGVDYAPIVMISGEQYGVLSYEEYKEIIREKLGFVTEEEVVVEEVVIVEESLCDGCIYGNHCLNAEGRKEGYYCDYDDVLREQKDNKISCDNNFECQSNSCYNSECVVYSEGYEAMFNELVDWFKEVFGSK